MALTDCISALERDFTSLLHAQHLVSHPVSAAIQSHLDNPDPPKALVLSFLGPTGVGKNFVSDIIADSLFQGGRRNKFVHTVIGPHHFPHSTHQGAYSVSCLTLHTFSPGQKVCNCVGVILTAFLTEYFDIIFLLINHRFKCQFFFQKKQEHISTFYIIPLHWHDRGS